MLDLYSKLEKVSHLLNASRYDKLFTQNCITQHFMQESEHWSSVLCTDCIQRTERTSQVPFFCTGTSTASHFVPNMKQTIQEPGANNTMHMNRHTW